MRGDGTDDTWHDVGSTHHDLSGTRHDVGQTQHDPSGSPYDTGRTEQSVGGSQYDTDGSQYGAEHTRQDMHQMRRPDATRALGPDDVSMRFGPGVTPDVIDTWRSGRGQVIKQRSLARRLTGLLVTLAIAVLAGVVVWWLLHGAGTALNATGATVHAPTKVQPCGSSVNVTGVIATNGGSGDVSYRWRRSDGQDSGILTDSVPHGRHSVTVHLRWTVTGPGRLHAIATLEVLSPVKRPVTATGAFDYSC